MTSISPDLLAIDADAARALAAANRLAFERMTHAEPVLVDVQRALDVVPGMTPQTILTSGAPLPWSGYGGGQRNAILGGAVFEGLAADAADADRKLADGRISLRPCHDHGCVGSVAGVATASMPVLVVENANGGNRGFCTLFEGASPQRLNYGVYNDAVRTNLLYLQERIAPVLADAVRATGGIRLRPIIRRALHMGDDLHSRNTAATLLFTRELVPALLELQATQAAAVRDLFAYLAGNDYSFLRLSMAAAKIAADAAHGVDGSSVVTAMAMSCRELAIRVSGLGAEWFRGPLPELHAAKLFDGYTHGDIELMGGESTIAETVGLGGFAQAAAFALQDYQGGSSERMAQANLELYRITVGEHPEYRIPFLGFRGVPTGIDVFRVVATGTAPGLNIGVPGKSGGQIGAGHATAPLVPFAAAAVAYARRYGRSKAAVV
jgi:hypothetical protein